MQGRMAKERGAGRRAASETGLCAIVLLAIGLLVGCGGPAAKSTTDAGGKSPETSEQLAPAEILERMLAAYRDADSYRDDATVTLSYRQGGRAFRDEAPIAVRFERPGRLRVQAYQVTLACDGRELRCQIKDESTRDIDGQFLVRPAPERLSLAGLLDEPLVADQLGNALVADDAGKLPLQLAFLLSDAPISLVSDQDVDWKRLEPGTADGRSCWRIQAKTARGAFTFWVDREDFLLRRFEYPREALAGPIAKDREVRDLQLVANFRNAARNAELNDEDFALAAPGGARQVRFFVPPPQPLPTEKFGETFERLSLTVPDGDPVHRGTLGERIAVLLWFSHHPACESAAQQFDAVRRKFADDSRLAFYVVATEPSSVSHQRLRDALRAWKVDAPLARDLAAHGRDQLDVHDTPTLVVLDGAGKLQLYEVGVNPQMAEQLPEALEKLLAGEDLASQIRRRQEEERERYERRLALASGGGEPLAVVDVPDVPLAPESAPKRLRLERRWRVEEPRLPGNVLVVPPSKEGEATRLFVLSDQRRVVVLNAADGGVLESIELQLPDEARATQFRTIVDGQGRRYFTAWSAAQEAVRLFDDSGRRLATYPPEDAQAGGAGAVRDVRLADLDADGVPEWYVAFVGVAGVHGVDREGKRTWSDRSLGAGLSLALSPPNPVGWRKLLAVGARGQVVRYNQFGNADSPQVVSGWTLVQLAGGEHGAGAKEAGGGEEAERKAAYCGLAVDRDGKLCLLALDERLAEQWNYPVPEGVWRSAVEPLRSTDLLGPRRPGWLAATVDGGVHVVSDDGEFSDYWHLGRLPTGLASTRLADGAAVLFVATAEGLEAWNVTAP